jgi:hypothetical protein
MRFLKPLMLLVILAILLASCNKDLNVNADWQDVTVVYALLNQEETIHYVKITKAFLGPGDAMQFATVPDSSNYPDKLEVTLEEYNGSILLRTFLCDTTTIPNKDSGIFYYPDQLVYYTEGQLNENYLYKLNIRNKTSNKEITSQTILVNDFTVEKPQASPQQITFKPGQNTEVKWIPAEGGKRYQLTIRFYYLETLISNPSQSELKYLDWLIFNDIKIDYPLPPEQPLPYSFYIGGEAFYAFVGSKIPVNPAVTRAARYFNYYFTVGAEDLDTYMEVTEPSLSIVQERPPFSNIVNGIGLFSSRYINTIDSLEPSKVTKDELKVNPYTSQLGF